MSIDLQTKLMGVVDELVGNTEVEDSLCRSQYFRFHAVLCHYTVEMLGKHSVSLRNLSVTLPLVHGSTDKAVLANSIF